VPDDERLAELTELLAETGRKHHEAFSAAGGVDPEWPLWYAEHLEDEIEPVLGAHLTRSKLVQCLLDAAEAHAAAGDDRPWPAFYAAFMLSLDGDRRHTPEPPATACPHAAGGPAGPSRPSLW